VLFDRLLEIDAVTAVIPAESNGALVRPLPPGAQTSALAIPRRRHPVRAYAERSWPGNSISGIVIHLLVNRRRGR
jgi:hypothetical protein